MKANLTRGNSITENYKPFEFTQLFLMGCLVDIPGRIQIIGGKVKLIPSNLKVFDWKGPH